MIVEENATACDLRCAAFEIFSNKNQPFRAFFARNSTRKVSFELAVSTLQFGFINDNLLIYSPSLQLIFCTLNLICIALSILTDRRLNYECAQVVRWSHLKSNSNYNYYYG